MNNDRYRYLFPYEKIKPNTNILIYGAGIVGMEYLKQILITHYCNVIGLVDKNYKEYASFKVPVFSPDEISKLEIDYVVIAVSTGRNVNEIKKVLFSQGIDEDKIVCIFTREDDVSVYGNNDSMEISQTLAYQRSNISLALLLSGGIGDMVMNKRFVEEIIRFVPNILIDIYYANSGDFLKYLYSDCDNVNIVIPNLGTRYAIKCSEYTIGIEVAALRYVHVDIFKKERFEILNKEFVVKVCKLMEESKKEDFNLNTLNYVILGRRLYNGYNAYTRFNYNGAFDIKDKNVHIPLTQESEKYFRNLELGKYITINCGNGVNGDGSSVSKAWPHEYYEEFAILFKKKYTTINLVQIGDDNITKINGADRYLLGEDFGVVSHVLKNSIFHFDIEGGLVHIAFQLGTKCVVLFGPTSKEYFGYDNNINICAGTCHNCYGLYKNQYKCARNMSEPECMYSITPELVMKHVDSYMESIGY